MQIEKKGTELTKKTTKKMILAGIVILAADCPRLQSAGVLFRLIFFGCSRYPNKIQRP